MAAPGSFTAGSVLTAAEMNALPGGALLVTQKTSDTSSVSTSEVVLCTGSFTAVAGRNYYISAYGFFYSPSTSMVCKSFIYWGATKIQELNVFGSGTVTHGNLSLARLYTAVSSGSVTVEFRVQASTGTFNMAGNANYPMQLIVHDAGDQV